MKQDMLFLPLTVSGYKARQDAVKATWAKDLNLHWLDKENGFEHIPIDFVDYITKEIPFDYKWYVFCDDDSHLFVDRIIAVLDNYGCDASICLGNIISLAGDASCTYPSGVCFIISRAEMLALKQFLGTVPVPELPRHRNHDVSMGMWCRSIGIQLIETGNMYGTHPWALGHSDEVIRQALAYNHIGPEDQARLQSYE